MYSLPPKVKLYIFNMLPVFFMQFSALFQYYFVFSGPFLFKFLKIVFLLTICFIIIYLHGLLAPGFVHRYTFFILTFASQKHPAPIRSGGNKKIIQTPPFLPSLLKACLHVGRHIKSRRDEMLVALGVNPGNKEITQIPLSPLS